MAKSRSQNEWTSQFSHLDLTADVHSEVPLHRLRGSILAYSEAIARETVVALTMTIRYGSTPGLRPGDLLARAHASKLRWANLDVAVRRIVPNSLVDAVFHHAGVHVRINRHTSTALAATVVVSRGADQDLQSEVVYLLLRNLALHLQVRQRILLHASAVWNAGQVTAFAGPSGAGKTCMLLESMFLPGTRPISNGMLFSDSRLRSEGWPSHLSLDETVLEEYPTLGGIQPQKRLSSSAAGVAESPKATLPLSEVVVRLRTRYERYGRLRAIIRPCRVFGGPTALRPLAEFEVASHEARLIIVGNAGFLPWHGFRHTQSCPTSLGRSEWLDAARALGLPFYLLHWRSDALGEARAILRNALELEALGDAEPRP